MPDITVTVTLDTLTHAAYETLATAQQKTVAELAARAVAEDASAAYVDFQRTMLASIPTVWDKFTPQEKAATIATYKAAQDR